MLKSLSLLTSHDNSIHQIWSGIRCPRPHALYCNLAPAFLLNFYQLENAKELRISTTTEISSLCRLYLLFRYECLFPGHLISYSVFSSLVIKHKTCLNDSCSAPFNWSYWMNEVSRNKHSKAFEIRTMGSRVPFCYFKSPFNTHIYCVSTLRNTSMAPLVFPVI